ncbi:hypothetical protein RI367_004463 [Sorochytrium milnesiophthora]
MADNQRGSASIVNMRLPEIAVPGLQVTTAHPHAADIPGLARTEAVLETPSHGDGLASVLPGHNQTHLNQIPEDESALKDSHPKGELTGTLRRSLAITRTAEMSPTTPESVVAPDPAQALLSDGDARAASASTNVDESRAPSVIATAKRIPECIKMSPWVVWIRAHTHRIYSQPEHQFWFVWDCIIRLIELYYLASAPLMVAFTCEWTLTALLMFYLLDAIMLLTLFMQLTRPMRDEYGQLLDTLAKRRKHYFSSPLAKYEIVGSIPYDLALLIYAAAGGRRLHDIMQCRNPTYMDFTGNVAVLVSPNTPYAVDTYTYTPSDIPGYLLFYCFLRMVRLLRTGRTVLWALQCQIPRVHFAITRLIKNLLFSLLLSHWDSCLYWLVSTRLVASDSSRWIEEQHILFDSQGLNTPFLYRYAFNFHGAQKALFFLPRDVTTVLECIYQIFEALCAAVIYGSIFGNLASIMRVFDSQAAYDKAAKTRNFRKRFLKEYMKKHEFPASLQRKVIDQEEFDWVHKRGMNIESLFDSMPKGIRQEVSMHLYLGLISKVPLFKTADTAFKIALADRVSTITVQSGFYICKAGDAGTEMYFIRKGSVQVWSADETKLLVTLGDGNYFGEIALFEECRRTATVRTACETELCVLKKDDFNAILRDYPWMTDVIFKAIEERKREDEKRKAQEAAKKAAEQHILRQRAAANGSFAHTFGSLKRRMGGSRPDLVSHGSLPKGPSAKRGWGLRLTTKANLGSVTSMGTAGSKQSVRGGGGGSSKAHSSNNHLRSPPGVMQERDGQEHQQQQQQQGDAAREEGAA